MFLNELSNIEKNAFLSLSVHAAKANNILEESEIKIIKEYMNEMNIDSFNIEETQSLDEIVNVFKNSENKHKKICVLELMGLIYIDGEYDNNEQELVDSFVNKIGLDENELRIIHQAIKKYIDALKVVFMAIN